MTPATACRERSPVKARSILLVEDDPPVAGLTELMLCRRGFDVTVVHNAESAWELLERNRFDLVVADVVLPGMSGTQFCQRICEDDTGRSLPVILVTGHPNELDLSSLAELAEQSVVVVFKPFKPDELAAAIRQRLAENSAVPAVSPGE